MERIRVVDAAAMILRRMGVEVPLKFLPHMPTGPYNRVAAHRLQKNSLAGNPVPFREGIVKTIDWYVKNPNPDEVRNQLQSMLTER